MKCHICGTENTQASCAHYNKTDMTNKEYYLNELAKVKPHATEYAPTIKIFANGNGQDTKHLNLNEVSAQVLIDWLQANFIYIYGVRCKETGTPIDKGYTEEQAKGLIEKFEELDKGNGNYSPDFYEVYNLLKP